MQAPTKRTDDKAMELHLMLGSKSNQGHSGIETNNSLPPSTAPEKDLET